MTDLEYSILSFIHSRNNPYWTDVLNTMSTQTPPMDTDAVLRNLLSMSKIQTSGQPFNLSRVSLTPDGISWLLSEKDFRMKEQLSLQQQIKQEQQRKADDHRVAEAQAASQREERISEHRFQIRLTFLQAALTFLAGAITTNLDRLIPWLISLFR